MNAAHLRAARTLAGLTQRQLAAEAGVHPNSVKYWEAQTGGVAGHAVSRIMAALGRYGITYAEEFAGAQRTTVLKAQLIPAGSRALPSPADKHQ